VIYLKLNFILGRSNFFQAHTTDFDFNKNFISYREIIHSLNIKELSSEEIEKFKLNILKEMQDSFPRNGIEYINDKGLKSLNVLIVDYPLDQGWKNNAGIQYLISFIESYFDIDRSSTESQVIEMNNIEHVIEVDSSESYDLEKLEDLHDLFDEYGIEYKVIYEKTYEVNIGATGGGLKAVFEVIGHVANIISIKEFLKKHFSYEPEAIQSHDINKVKKQLSEHYKIHEGQLELESYDYDEDNHLSIYIFTSRDYQYFMTYDKGKLISTSREKSE